MPQTTAAARAGQARLAAVPDPGAPPLDVFESKLRVPQLAAGTVSRTGVVNRLRAEGALRLATVVAPAGYGKTTLLAQWAARDERPFVWVSIDDRDNDPLILLRHLAAALDRVEPLDPSVAEGLAGDVWKVAAPRLVNEFSARARPFVAVFDDADRLRRGESAELVAALGENVPEGSMLALAGRVPPRVGVARLRAGRRLLELGPAELALNRREAQLLLRGAGVELEAAEVAELNDKVEGWAAGLYLLRGGDERDVADYLDSEYLTRLTPGRLAFLERTSVLDRLYGPLCDAVTGSTGSAAELQALERAGLFFVPLDPREWHRYHRLFRETLLHRLEANEPTLVPVLHRRAADWFEAHGKPTSALNHVLAAGDTGRAARLLTEIAMPTYYTGRAAAVEAWLERFGPDASPEAAALGAWLHALRGRASEARTWLGAADGPLAELLRVAMCDGTLDGLAHKLERAVAALPDGDPWLGVAALLRGGIETMRGSAAATSFAEAAGAGSGDIEIAALGAGSLAAADQTEAERLALEARALAVDGPVRAYPATAIARAAAARVFLKRGRWDAARRELLEAEPLAQQLTETLPWLAVETLLALAAAYAALRDRACAGARLGDLDELVARHECLDGFRAQVRELRRQLDELPDDRDGRSSGLTAAELRLLPLLATHLSFREIGERLYVSRNTIKTQAISTYRKLGVSSRSAAIERGGELGLVDDATAPPEGFIQPG